MKRSTSVKATMSSRGVATRAVNWGWWSMPLLLLTLLVLWACGGAVEEDFACCNAGRYYSCPNKSAALVCDDSLSPDTVCDFEPENNDLCR